MKHELNLKWVHHQRPKIKTRLYTHHREHYFTSHSAFISWSWHLYHNFNVNWPIYTIPIIHALHNVLWYRDWHSITQSIILVVLRATFREQVWLMYTQLSGNVLSQFIILCSLWRLVCNCNLGIDHSLLIAIATLQLSTPHDVQPDMTFYGLRKWAMVEPTPTWPNLHFGQLCMWTGANSRGLDEWFWAMFESTPTWHNFYFFILQLEMSYTGAMIIGIFKSLWDGELMPHDCVSLAAQLCFLSDALVRLGSHILGVGSVYNDTW